MSFWVNQSVFHSAFGTSLSCSRSLVRWFIHSSFSLCCFGCHILVQNRSVSFAFGCWYVLLSYPPNCYCYYHYYYWEFFTSAFSTGVWVTASLLDIKSPQVSRSFLSILDDLNNTVVWTVFTHPVFSKSSNPCTNPLLTVPRAPITIGIIVTFMFHSFFHSQARPRYLSLFSHSFNFTLWSTETAKSTILQVLFSFSFRYFKV